MALEWVSFNVVRKVLRESSAASNPKRQAIRIVGAALLLPKRQVTRIAGAVRLTLDRTTRIACVARARLPPGPGWASVQTVNVELNLALTETNATWRAIALKEMLPKS
jgi:hypothetical protein